ncbi:MAG: NAD(P)-binding domain-containing protein [Gammaproteobacteria bacterium]
MASKVQYDVIIIGAGQCGTSLAYYFAENNISYLILEKDRAFSSWYKRWESFYMNTANWMNLLPGMSDYSPALANNCFSRAQIINHFEQWLKKCSSNIKIACVTNIKAVDSEWLVTTTIESYYASHLIVAIGFNETVLPKCSDKLSHTVKHLHSSDYINPAQITTENVLIVGTGSSGVQICEDLAKTKKHSIILSCSNNRYFNWTLLGISIYQYVRVFKLFDIKSQSFFGRLIRLVAINKGDPATPPRPKYLQSKYGVELQGKVADIKNDAIIFDTKESIALSDITIIWCTGFKLNLDSIIDDSIKSKILHSNGYPKLISAFESVMPNLYFMGLRFQRLISSHTVYGAVKDSKKLADEIKNKLVKKL